MMTSGLSSLDQASNIYVLLKIVSELLLAGRKVGVVQKISVSFLELRDELY